MSIGSVFPPCEESYTDGATGAVIRRVTDFPAITHHPFYYLRPFDDAMTFLTFTSHRTGRPELYVEWQQDRKIVQITDQEGINDYSFQAGPDGRYVFFTTGQGAWRVDPTTCKQEEICRFGELVGTGVCREKGMVGAAMGTTTVSGDGSWWAIPVKTGATSRLIVIDTETGKGGAILEADSIGHPEFHPDDSSLIRYAGPYTNRIWIVRRDGTENRLVYERDAAKKEWIVHETWRPGSHEILTTQWRHGVIGIDTDTGSVRRVCSFNAWHPSVNRTGTMMCADTTYPDIGLQLFDVLDGIGEPEPLCLSESSNVGAHWDTDHCPYDDGPIDVYAPQHTHPHPAFSPDGRRIVYTSDRTGTAQVYTVTIPDSIIRRFSHE